MTIVPLCTGPTVTTVSKLVAPWLQLWIDALQFEFHPRDEPYLFFCNGDVTRCQTSSQWTATVKQAFQRWSPNQVACPPKMLRTSFITHLRSSDAAPEVLQVRMSKNCYPPPAQVHSTV